MRWEQLSAGGEIVVESRSFDIDGETSIDTGPADTDQ